VALDITERERAETALRSAEQKFSKAFRNNPEGMTISTLEDGRFIDANDAFLKMLEYQPSELIGQTIGDLNIWENLEERTALLEKLKAEHSLHNESTTFRTKSGKIRQIQLSAEIIPLAGETCLLAVMRDVTEQKTLEEQFRQAQKMEAVGRLAGGIAHDFNNLVAVILGYSEFIGSEVPSDSPVQRYLEPIQKAAKSAAGLTSQLLAFSRRQVLQPRVLNLNTTVSEAERMLRRLLGEDIEVSIVADPGLGNVNADPGHILQVLMNLAVNARDAMPNGGKLSITTANSEFSEGSMIDGVGIPPGAYVKLTVRDTGIGMDPETSSQIFEPFFTTKPAGKGTGLGLATVYGIIKQSEGYIFVQSAPGLGTAFDILLPRVFARVEKTVEKPPEFQEPASGTVLLVEDEPLVRDLLNETLKNAGYAVVAAENGAEALQAAGRLQGNIDLLLTDVIMPEMNGPDLASWLLSARPGMKVLYMSGYTDDKLGPLDTADPEVPILQKPFGREELLEKVRHVMHHPTREFSHNRKD
jgi:PAS domain S-box-containing protein